MTDDKPWASEEGARIQEVVLEAPLLSSFPVHRHQAAPGGRHRFALIHTIRGWGQIGLSPGEVCLDKWTELGQGLSRGAADKGQGLLYAPRPLGKPPTDHC